MSDSDIELTHRAEMAVAQMNIMKLVLENKKLRAALEHSSMDLHQLYCEIFKDNLNRHGSRECTCHVRIAEEALK